MSWQFHTVNILGRFRGALQRNDPRSDAGDGSASDHQRGTVPEQPRKHTNDGFTGLRPQSGPQPGRKTQRGQNSVCTVWNHTELKTSRKRTKIKNRKWRNLRLQKPWDLKRISSGINKIKSHSISFSSRVPCTATGRRSRTTTWTALPTVPPSEEAVVRFPPRPPASLCRHRLLTSTCVGSPFLQTGGAI